MAYDVMTRDSRSILYVVAAIATIALGRTSKTYLIAVSKGVLVYWVAVFLGLATGQFAHFNDDRSATAGLLIGATFGGVVWGTVGKFSSNRIRKRKIDNKVKVPTGSDDALFPAQVTVAPLPPKIVFPREFNRGLLYGVLGSVLLSVGVWYGVYALLLDEGLRLRRESEDVKSRHDNGERLFTSGVAHSTKDEHAEALADYNKAIALNPNDPFYYSFRASTYRDLGAKDQAIKDYTSAIKLTANNFHFFNDRGNVYYAKGDYDKAIDDFTTAIDLNPTMPYLFAGRCAAQNRILRFELAISDCTKAISMYFRPMSALEYIERGTAYLAIRDNARAVNDFSVAANLKPNDAAVFHSRGVAYRNLGEGARAEADFISARNLGFKD